MAPSFLYKFTKLEYLLESIDNGVYSAPIIELNDPYEWEGIEYPEMYRVCSLTRSWRQMLLWAYYGNHRGCVLKVDCKEINESAHSLIRKVQYQALPRVSRRNLSADEIIEALYQKGKEWEHENEYRAVYSDNGNQNHWSKVGDKVYLNAPVKEIIFGCCSALDKQYYVVLQELNRRKKNGQSVPTISKVMIRDDKYELAKDRQYNYQMELRRFLASNKK